MPRTRPLYPPESVVRRCTGALGRFAQGGRGRPGHVGADAAYWRRQGDIDAGRAEGLTSDDREELRRPRRQNRWLSQEREISKGGRGFSSRGRPIAGDVLPVNRREEVTACRLPAVQRARRQPGRLLRLKGPARSRRASAATASCWTRSPRSTARATAPMAGRASMPSCVTAASVCRKRVLRLMRWAGLSGMVRRFLTNASARSRLQPYAYAKSRRVGDSQRPWPGPVETSVSGSGSVALFATSRAMRSALSRCRRPAAGGSRDQFRGGAAWRRRRPSALGGRARSRRVSVQSKVSGGARSS
jgi:hypothetical protein